MSDPNFPPPFIPNPDNNWIPWPPAGATIENIEQPGPGGVLDNVRAGRILNQSGIDLDLAKLADQPPDFHEIDGYGETWERKNNAVVRVFVGPWGTRKRFIDYLLGYSTNVGGQFRRSIPAQHPEYPWLYADAVTDVQGLGAFTNNPNVVDANGNLIPIIAYYDASTGSDGLSCKLKVTYRSADGYVIRTDKEMADNGLTELARYVRRHETYAMQSLPIPGWQFWVDDPNAPADIQHTIIPEATINKLFPMKEVTYTWMEVPDCPEAAIDACEGRTNSAAFDPAASIGGVNVGGWNQAGYAAGTLLMLNPHKEPYRTATGRWCWEIVYKFLYRVQGWNNLPAKDGQFYAIRCKKDPTISLYDPADFSKLFVAPDTMLYQGPKG